MEAPNRKNLIGRHDEFLCRRWDAPSKADIASIQKYLTGDIGAVKHKVVGAREGNILKVEGPPGPGKTISERDGCRKFLLGPITGVTVSLCPCGVISALDKPAGKGVAWLVSILGKDRMVHQENQHSNPAKFRVKAHHRSSL